MGQWVICSGAECQILSFVSISHNQLELASITTTFNWLFLSPYISHLRPLRRTMKNYHLYIKLAFLTTVHVETVSGFATFLFATRCGIQCSGLTNCPLVQIGNKILHSCMSMWCSRKCFCFCLYFVVYLQTSCFITALVFSFFHKLSNVTLVKPGSF